jgi:hypothetical protein
MFEAPQRYPPGIVLLTKSSSASEKGKSSILAGVPPTTKGDVSIDSDREISRTAKSEKNAMKSFITTAVEIEQKRGFYRKFRLE